MWEQLGETPKFATWGAMLNYYRSHHPIIMGFAILGTISLSCSIYLHATKVDKYTAVTKYKETFIVYRPDDPHLEIIKTRPIGLDWFDKK